MKQTFSIIVGLQISICAAFALLVLACGVKKDVVQQEQQANKEQQTNVPSAVNDSLAYLGDLINDSTIHINYVYGIPFIIDDCVPMFLPPIDKEPKGYECKMVLGERRFNDLAVFEVSSIIDSIPWLNKCLNEIQPFLLNPSNNIPLQHNYDFRISVLKADDKKLIEIRTFQTGITGCYPSVLLQQCSCYYFDISGNLVGKSYMSEPHCFIGTYPLRKMIPDFNKFYMLLSSHLKPYRLIILHHRIENPNDPPCDEY